MSQYLRHCSDVGNFDTIYVIKTQSLACVDAAMGSPYTVQNGGKGMQKGVQRYSGLPIKVDMENILLQCCIFHQNIQTVKVNFIVRKLWQFCSLEILLKHLFLLFRQLLLMLALSGKCKYRIDNIKVRYVFIFLIQPKFQNVVFIYIC